MKEQNLNGSETILAMRKPASGYVRQALCFVLGLLLAFAPQLVSQSASAVQANLLEPTTASVLVQQGRSRYQAGQYAEASALLSQAAQAHRLRGAPLNLALTLGYLALADQKLGHLEAAKAEMAESVDLLQDRPASRVRNRSETKPETRAQVLAQVMNMRGQLQFAWGQPEDALESWKQSQKAYQTLDDSVGELGSQINQVQALRTLGFYRRAQSQLSDFQSTMAALPDGVTKAEGLRSLGNVLRTVGDLAGAQVALEQSLEMLEQLPGSQGKRAIAPTLLSLGNTLQSQGNQQLEQFELSPSVCAVSNLPPTALPLYERAVDAYRQSEAIALTPSTQLQSRLNRLSLEQMMGQPLQASSVNAIATQLDTIGMGRSAIYQQIAFSRLLSCGSPSATELDPGQGATLDLAIRVLQNAQQQAQRLGDARAQSEVLGQLGRLYESQGQNVLAERQTKAAVKLADRAQALDIAYQWHWQLGRLYRTQGNTEAAIAAYSQSVDALQTLRSDLVGVNVGLQFSFRRDIEPIYRELVSLLLKSDRNRRQPELLQSRLVQARDVIEALQLAELDNFFQDACSTAEPVLVDRITDQDDPTAAVFYPILLPDRLEVIVKLPGQSELQQFSTTIPADRVQTVIQEFRRQLEEPYTARTVRTVAAEVYGWLVAPMEATLAKQGVKTLVFIMDGVLRNIPISALYTGDHYLIEDYAVAMSPGLQLLDPQPLQAVESKLLLGALTEARQGFIALPGVEQEVEEVSQVLPGDVTLVDEQFVETAIEDALGNEPVSIVHLATHGQFSSQAEDTFILLYDEKLQLKELESVLKARNQSLSQSIELLVLSACETAAGDERATLGLAGVAVRAGARSTLASLWQVDDEQTSRLIRTFYRSLYQDGKAVRTKAEALRQAQLSILQGEARYRHPRYWSAFVMLGNWL